MRSLAEEEETEDGAEFQEALAGSGIPGAGEAPRLYFFYFFFGRVIGTLSFI